VTAPADEIWHTPAPIQQWFDTWEGPLQSEAREQVLRIYDDVAVVYALRCMRGTKKGGTEIELWFRSTAICTRTVGGWKISHIHNSMPFAMDGGGKALLDLKP